jgi:hypothetical protein
MEFNSHISLAVKIGNIISTIFTKNAYYFEHIVKMDHPLEV